MARLNENENENQNETTAGARLFAGARFNTHKILKQAFDPKQLLFPPAQGPGPNARYGYMAMGGWDPEDYGWVYILDFIRLRPTWFNDLERTSEKVRVEHDFTDDATLTAALLEIVDAAGEREDRFAEILHQQDADGCISYWTSMLRIDRARHPNTYQLIRVARKLGEMVVMALKAHSNEYRPSQISPSIVPMFDPPRTASFPAGHALQSYLMSYLLKRVMPSIPQSDPPPLDHGHPSWQATHTGLFALARRVSDNRVIAGVHFDRDCEAGFRIAHQIDKWFGEWDKKAPGYSVADETDQALRAPARALSRIDETRAPAARTRKKSAGANARGVSAGTIPALVKLLRAAQAEFPQFQEPAARSRR